jgi:hypothetical protein
MIATTAPFLTDYAILKDTYHFVPILKMKVQTLCGLFPPFAAGVARMATLCAPPQRHFPGFMDSLFPW